MSNTRESNMLRTLRCVSSTLWICLILAQLHLAAADTDSWSISLGGVSLFNIPKFGTAWLTRQFRSQDDISTELVSGEYIEGPEMIDDVTLTTPELLRKYGYPAEVHHTVTEDGYILEMHRIANPGKIPVLLVHGLLDSSVTWVLMGPNKGLGYLLFDLGYDVWMTNVRGNTYSRNHTKYSTSHPKYWDFSFHEMGIHDVPSSIDYVLENTGAQQLHYIGHSQGTTTFWIMCSERPEYSEKVILMQALAPVAYIKHSKSPVVEFLAFFQEPLSILLKMVGANEFLPNNEFMKMFSQIVCDDDIVTKEICSNVIFLIVGFDNAQMNETMLPVVLGHLPAGASTKQMQHFGQLKRSGAFRQFDYGWIRNHWRYNSITPPSYKLGNVINKVALHYSQNDWLATPEDVERLHFQLPNVIGKFLVNYPKFNHLDFVWSIDAYELLYKRVVKLMSLVERDEI